MHRLSFLLILIGLSGCLPLSTYYAEGVSLAKLDRDQTACAVKALRDAPVANQIRQESPRLVRKEVCDRNGICRNEYDREAGELYSVDVNEDLRTKLQGQCMRDLGYRSVEIPACSGAVARAAPASPSTVFPRLTSNSCAIRLDNGQFRIVNQGSL